MTQEHEQTGSGPAGTSAGTPKATSAATSASDGGDGPGRPPSRADGRDPGPGDEDAARAAVIEACLRMTSLGLNTGRAGNISLRWHRGGPQGEGMLVTPSAIAYESLQVDDIVWLPLAVDDETVARGQAVPAQPASGQAGALRRVRASSEWRLHRDVHRGHADCGAVVHTHSRAATALACLPAIQAQGIPAFHYMVAVAGGADIRCAPYRTFGTAALSQAALVALAGRRACLLANHGVVALGATLSAALEMAAEVEALAAMYAQAMQLGEPAVLDREEMARVLERFADYRGESARA